MAYIGKSPVIGNFVKLDAITAVNGQAAYTMQNGGSNFTDYESVNQFLVSLNGTIQAPTDSFTVSGSTLTFASNLSTGDVIDFIMVFGNSLSAGTPTDATVSTAKIVDDAVTAAKINDDIISGATELATEPADTDEFLVSDAGTLKRIDYSLIKGGGLVLLSSTDFSGSSSNVEISLDYSAHKNFLLVCSNIQGSSTSQGENCDVHLKRDGESSFNTGANDYGFGGTTHDTNTAINVNNADAMEVFRGRDPSQDNMFVAQITGSGTTDTKTSFKVQYTQCDISHGGTTAQTIYGTADFDDRVVAIRFSFTAGTVTILKANLYGYGE
jgi:hypothetical protein